MGNQLKKKKQQGWRFFLMLKLVKEDLVRLWERH